MVKSNRSKLARATPLLGHEGPLSSLLALEGVPLVHADAHFDLIQNA